MSQGVCLICIAIITPCFAVAAPASGAGGKKGAMLSSAPASPTPSTGHGGGGGGRQRIDPRNVPPLDPDRKVNEQDCTKPIDLTRGNLKCK